MAVVPADISPAGSARPVRVHRRLVRLTLRTSHALDTRLRDWRHKENASVAKASIKGVGGPES
eukprot:148810-Prorocentrum_minimum.AAC.1